MTDLNELIPADSGVTLTGARAINSNGQIACQAEDQTGSNVAVLLTPIPATIGDVNCNKAVDVDDLLEVINAWGKCEGSQFLTPCPADLTDNHIVDVDDLLMVINNWTF